MVLRLTGHRFVGIVALAAGAALVLVALSALGSHGSAGRAVASRSGAAVAGQGSAAAVASHSSAAAGAHGSIAATYAKLPLSFEPNRGQFDRRALYAAQGAGYTLFLTHSGVVMSLAAGAGGAAGRVHQQGSPPPSNFSPEAPWSAADRPDWR